MIRQLPVCSTKFLRIRFDMHLLWATMCHGQNTVHVAKTSKGMVKPTEEFTSDDAGMTMTYLPLFFGLWHARIDNIIYIYIYIHIYIYIFKRYVYIYIYTYIHTDICIYTYTYTYTYIYIYIYIYVYMYIYICIYIYMVVANKVGSWNIMLGRHSGCALHRTFLASPSGGLLKTPLMHTKLWDSLVSGWWFGTCFWSRNIGKFIISTDELIFFRRVAQPPNRWLYTAAPRKQYR